MKQMNLINKVLHYLDLESEVDDFDKIHATIEKDIVFKGTNLWILIFAIIVASVGLNMNSAAVIIGAMLISPLMGPINGIGYSIATYNFPLFRKAVKNLTFAVVVSLVASTTYFAISPISTAHSELLARTSPTIYDVLIALFGGLAGIVAMSSKQKGNVIPGVAIATALMPPLCTAGYGLASGHYYYFFGAIYLFTINAVFIAISAVIISQILKFPIRTIASIQQRKKVNRIISIVITLILIPSIYFGYQLVQKEKFVENAMKFVNNVGIVDGSYLLQNEVNPNKRTIVLTYGGTTITETQKNEIEEKANDFFLSDSKIIFKQGLSFDAINRDNTEAENLKAEMNRLSLLLQEKDNQIDSINDGRLIGRQVLAEIKKIYPQIVACSYSDAYVFSDATSDYRSIGVAVFTINSPINKTERDKINKWIETRLDNNNIKVYYQNK